MGGTGGDGGRTKKLLLLSIAELNRGRCKATSRGAAGQDHPPKKKSAVKLGQQQGRDFLTQEGAGMLWEGSRAGALPPKARFGELGAARGDTQLPLSSPLSAAWPGSHKDCSLRRLSRQPRQRWNMACCRTKRTRAPGPQVVVRGGGASGKGMRKGRGILTQPLYLARVALREIKERGL